MFGVSSELQQLGFVSWVLQSFFLPSLREMMKSIRVVIAYLGLLLFIDVV